MVNMRKDSDLTSAVRDPNALFQLPLSAVGDEPRTAAAEAPPPPSATVTPEETKNAAGEDDQPHSPTLPCSSSSTFPLPTLRLEVRDVMHTGAHRFLSRVDASATLPTAVANVQRILYNTPKDHTTHLPPTRSVTLILRDMDGVAYTTGSELDSDHKEIHFSLHYIESISKREKCSGDENDGIAHEIVGVITHELVHCYQWDAKGTCPGGLIEGIADFVRLRCGLSPPHWEKDLEGSWDRGYQHTAYFLDYLECRFGDGTVRKINEGLRTRKYEEKPFWTEIVGRPVEQLWADYVKASKCDEDPAVAETAKAVA
ncbi:hypothetical protein MCOR27_003415 [Pyricularia oryzae]|nr:hypothetical protein MCOR27_003415 [Pyricularia oryzae]KAI6288507.1 hypothetical protein MCOR26_000106 [Pyricularia oryzae]KAI6331389.1 hypothetical protein MCOR28_011337 [Pyricularia oryzae]KAI6402350.1 hypothetical protein MCOR20_007727 [Pyricularia oryzae]KAI6410098.1 hypothetical protein MCOR23_000617 [Pyricularia oryzae]